MKQHLLSVLLFVNSCTAFAQLNELGDEHIPEKLNPVDDILL